MRHLVVNVATGALYQRGQARLREAILNLDERITCYQGIMAGWPSHQEKPYGFKAYALMDAAKYADLLLWCDASIIPLRELDPLWERIERDGYWIARNGWTNYEWTADSAYPDLFPDAVYRVADGPPETFGTRPCSLEEKRAINRCVPHVVATAFGINLRHETGAAILKEYYRLASETNAFCGPWINRNYSAAEDRPAEAWHGEREACCGPIDVHGHRHDQTALSVIAWRLGCELTSSPEYFAYHGGETYKTVLVAKGI